MSDDQSNDTADILKRAKDAFDIVKDAEDHNRVTALDDLRFSRLGEQWPDFILKQREAEQRPCLTINKMPAFVRQVVNDARQNKPSIKVHPVDSSGDPETAEVINGLIRNIEYTSNADTAYDTAVECAVQCGFGYFRVGMDYAFDDSFDMDITIDRISNPFSVYGDPHSTAADSHDWNSAFIVDRISREEYKRRYKGKAVVDFDDDVWNGVDDTWLNEDGVLIAEWWTREEYERDIVLLDDGRVFGADQLEEDEDISLSLELGALSIVDRRKTKSHKVMQYILSGVDVLKATEWPGRFIPIVPVYGDEFDVEGKRYFRSLVHNAKDAQRMFNFWRTSSTELVALAPRVPYLGEEGAFDVDTNWATANTKSHPYLEYKKGKNPPMRQPLDSGVAAGALQEALNASDDMKSIIGLYDASLGARSNETSGRAILARQQEGDVSTFHFIDNMARAIRHAGRILIDLIPKVYNTARIVRVIGEDGSQDGRQVNAPYPAVDEQGQPVQDDMGQPIMAMHDLTAGKYDLTVTTGPSFTTRRQEAAAQMVEFIRAYPQAAPVIGDILAKNLDWPGADEIQKRLEAISGASTGQLPPEVQQQIQQGMERIQELEQENTQLKSDRTIDQEEVGIKRFDAQTKRMKVTGDQQMDQAEFTANLVDRVRQPDPMRQG